MSTSQYGGRAAALIASAAITSSAFSASGSSPSWRLLAPDVPEECTPASVSDDGTVVGWCPAGEGTQAFRWSEAEGFEVLSSLPGALSTRANAIAANGSVIVGVSGSEAVYWTGPTNVVALGHLSEDATHSRATAVSHFDTVVIVGKTLRANGPHETWRWSADTGMVGLGFVFQDDPHSGDAWAVSAAGSFVFGREWTPGWTTTVGTRWSATYGMQQLAGLASATGVSGSGQVVVGYHGQKAVRSVNGVPSTIPQMDYPSGVSSDGRTVVGRYASTAQIWRCGCGSQSLKQYFLDLGVSEVAGHTLPQPQAISANGLYVVGPNYLARIPKRTDLNGDGVVDIFDLLVVLNAWGQADPCKSMFCASHVDIMDLLYILANWGEY